MSTPKNTLVKFENHGQSFLEWEIDPEGTIVASRPSNDHYWVDWKVVNRHFVKGGSVKVARRNAVAEIRHPIASVEKVTPSTQ